jgi:glycosyltransferase involved in cell wall biosynthesis
LTACKDDYLHVWDYDLAAVPWAVGSPGLRIKRDTPGRRCSIDPPLVTIGLPTHNGEPFLAQALESLLRQDHADLDIVVADNASTDRTPDILREFMRHDSRIRHERFEDLVSAPQNFNRAFSLGSGPYFMWAADDDLWDPSYVRRCLAALAADPMAVMASTGLRFIDPAGQILDANYGRYDNPDLSSRSVVERVRILLRRGGFYQVYGVAKRDTLERTHLFQDVYGPDVVLTLEIAMLGPIVRIPEPLFFYRRHPDRTEETRTERQGGIPGVDDILPTRMTHLQELLSEAVQRSALPGPTKWRLRVEVLRAAYVDDTPMRSRTRREVAIRTRAARRDGEPNAFAKYGIAWALEWIRGWPVAAPRIMARAKRVAARVRGRLR